MLSYYKRHIIYLTKKIRLLEEDKDNFKLLLETQLYILKRIISCEDKVRKRKKEFKIIKNKISKHRLSKQEASTLKDKVKKIKIRIKEYNWLLYIWRCFGDAIVFIYLDKWGIKPFLYDDITAEEKQSAGYINGKQGFKNELAVVLDAIENGVPAILNDLTNTIRHGDVCLLGDNDPYVIEIKSSLNTNRRTKRQINKIKNIHNYLKNDKGENVRGAETCIRVELKIPEVNYIPQINNQIEEALKSGFSTCSPEPGIHYLVLKTDYDLNFDKIFPEIGKEAIVHMLNEAKNEKYWACYYPFTLSIEKPEHLYAFLKGDIYIIVVFDIGRLKKIVADRGMTFEHINEENWAFSFKKTVEGSEPIFYKVSQHFAGRLACEFLSVKWMLDSDAENLKSMQSNFDKKV